VRSIFVRGIEVTIVSLSGIYGDNSVLEGICDDENDQGKWKLLWMMECE
jgi:hypothetical protein